MRKHPPFSLPDLENGGLPFPLHFKVFSLRFRASIFSSQDSTSPGFSPQSVVTVVSADLLFP